MAKRYLTDEEIRHRLNELMKADVWPVDTDYRVLLWKYMEHVGQCEGIDFTDSLPHSDEFITAAEKAELLRISMAGRAIANPVDD